MAAERRIAVAGGGTAGHILPAIEFLKTYRREFGAEGCFIGCAAGLETRLVPARGERLEMIPGLPWARQKWGTRLRAATIIPGAVSAARNILRREKTQLVIGAGGYASFSTCIAANSLGIPVVIHEPNARLGLANGILVRFASQACFGFPETANGLRMPTEVTGVPTGEIAPQWREDAPWRFLVLGGSEGSPILNREAPRLFGRMLGRMKDRGLAFSVRHIAGFGDVTGISSAYAAAGVTAEVEAFTDDMTSAYQDATYAIATGGIHTLAELSAAEVPVLIVPLSGAANDHQMSNARMYAARTGSRIVRESDWATETEASWLESIVADPGALRRHHENAASWTNRDAALRLVRACEKALRQHIEQET